MDNKYYTKRNKKGQFQKGNKNWLGRKHTKASKQKMHEAQTEEKNARWKGNDVGYDAVHTWIEKHKGLAKEHKCKYCSKQAYDWANKDHSYKRVLEDYMALCRKCHKKFDIKYNNLNIDNLKYSKRGKAKICQVKI